jgi:hypothetical protein
MNQAIAGEPLPASLTPHDLEDLLFQLGQFRKQRAAAHSYREGQRINDAMRNTERALMRLRKDGMQKEAKAEYEEELATFQAALQEFDNETKQRLKEIQDKQDEERKQLQFVHESQQRELTEHWSSPAKFRLYNRASNQVTILRRQHSILLMQCRFSDAEEVNRLIESRIKEEEATSHRMHQRDFEESTAYLTEKQKGEMESFETSVDVQLAQFNHKRAIQRRIFENKQKRIQVKGDIAKDPEKLWNLAQMQRLEDLSGAHAVRGSNSTLPSSKMTQRDIKDPAMIILSLPPLHMKTKRQLPVRKAPVAEND